MPKPPMESHNVRFPPALWAAAVAKADAQDSDVSTELRRLVAEWVAGDVS